MGRKANNLIFWGAGAILALSAVFTLRASPQDNNKVSDNVPPPAPWSDFVKKAEEGHFTTVKVSQGYVEGEHVTAAGVKEVVKTETGRLSADHVTETLEKTDVKIIQEKPPTPGFLSVLLQLGMAFLPMVLFMGLIMYMMKGAMKGPPGVKTTYAPVNPESNTTRLNDVAGVDEARAEVAEVIEFLQNPHKFRALGAKVPTGVLMSGPPGTGKTMLARAIAGEAGVPFFSISGSEFVQMFVGVGAMRVRSIFEEAKKLPAAIIFIDEIDAVGKKRGGNGFGSNDEREQTLNQILTEMDGFDKGGHNIIVIAATNQPETLDDALLRPGRFDRKVTISLPDVEGRAAILAVHAKGKPLDGVDLHDIARATPGFSGADLANIVNEAAIIAARRNAKRITSSDFVEAIDKTLMGPAKKSVMDEEKRALYAYHEAGHTLVLLHEAAAGRAGSDLHKVTIVGHGGTGGHTAYLPKDAGLQGTVGQLRANMRMSAGGRVAERLFGGDDRVTPGASSDIQALTGIARHMVIDMGMDAELGMVNYAPDSTFGTTGWDPATAQKITAAVQKRAKDAEDFATEVLTANAAQLETLATALFERETLTAEEVRALVPHLNMVEDPEARAASPGLGLKQPKLGVQKATELRV